MKTRRMATKVESESVACAILAVLEGIRDPREHYYFEEEADAFVFVCESRTRTRTVARFFYSSRLLVPGMSARKDERRALFVYWQEAKLP